jgi:hypothetical protein
MFLLIAINGSLTLQQATISVFYTMPYMKNIMSSPHKRFFDEFQGFFGLDDLRVANVTCSSNEVKS